MLFEDITFEGDAQFKEFGNYFGKVVEEFVVVSGICIHPFLENFILLLLVTTRTIGLLAREHNRLATS